MHPIFVDTPMTTRERLAYNAKKTVGTVALLSITAVWIPMNAGTKALERAFNKIAGIPNEDD